jgi:mono/diheme cytochrome c family protein
VPPSPTLAPATATTAPTLAPTQAPTSAPTQAPVAAAPANADNCVKCHTNEETLKKLAKAEEPAEKLSEGEG